ncbi:NAD-dependent epimerase/dehydratase family protein [Magnetospirillum molischianum]|uniref:Putative capsular polysaccharide biosynthesis protein n=1 Tax=Magnetospirillum molischianum DSM 120 TaxID=1150626 RepID=H8FWD3_MAGML|nr:NAD(P)-dependent oxidoreductase [Magnetospirillum molischianum]CCG42671.1 putative capsular polysaccharide biosynthesis protein [Magnetospirillum molischianum DSM 120]
MKRRILVLGGSGFIGRRVVAALAATDWADPVAASRHGDGLSLDATHPAALAAALPGFDAVVNALAASPATMVAATEALTATAAAQPTPPLLIQLSSMAVYGPVNGRVDEAAPVSAALGPYAAAKLATEARSRAYPRTVILRPGCVYGPGSAQWSDRIANLLHSRRIGDLGAGGDGIANLVLIDDVVAAILAALTCPEAEGATFNLAMADPPDWNNYFFRFAKALGTIPIARRSERRMRLETKLFAPPLKLLERIAARAGLDPNRLPPAIPPSLARLWRQEIQLDSTAAERVLGLRWSGLDQGLAATVNSAQSDHPAAPAH